MREILIYKHDPKATLPTRNHAVDAGIDLYALEDTFIPLGETKFVKTGIAARILDGYVGLVKDRSGLAKAGLRTSGGVIDAGYSGEITIVIHNQTNGETVHNWEESPFRKTAAGYMIKKGHRIAQLLIQKVELPVVIETKELWNSDRGAKGFSSSGK